MTGAMNDVSVTDVHAHILLPALHTEVERRAPEGVRDAAALDLRRTAPTVRRSPVRWSCPGSRS